MPFRNGYWISRTHRDLTYENEGPGTRYPWGNSYPRRPSLYDIPRYLRTAYKIGKIYSAGRTNAAINSNLASENVFREKINNMTPTPKLPRGRSSSSVRTPMSIDPPGVTYRSRYTQTSRTAPKMSYVPQNAGTVLKIQPFSSGTGSTINAYSGIVTEWHEAGEFGGQHATYFSTTTCPVFTISKHIGMALMKSVLFKTLKFSCEKITESILNINGLGNNTFPGYRISGIDYPYLCVNFSYMLNENPSTTLEYNTLFVNVVPGLTWYSAGEQLFDKLYQLDADYLNKFKKVSSINVWASTSATGSMGNSTLVHKIPAECINITINSKLESHYQNRTALVGGGTSTTDNAVQTLNCKVINCNNYLLVEKVKRDNLNLYPDTVTGNRSFDCTTDPDLCATPSKAMFFNANNVESLNISPGAILSTVVYFKKELSLSKWIMGNKLNVDNTTVKGTFGNSQVVFFEKLLDIGGVGSEPIDVVYETHRHFAIGCTIKNKKVYTSPYVLKL